jgi:hypothetical protein
MNRLPLHPAPIDKVIDVEQKRFCISTLNLTIGAGELARMNRIALIKNIINIRVIRLISVIRGNSFLGGNMKGRCNIILNIKNKTSIRMRRIKYKNNYWYNTDRINERSNIC